MARQAGVYHLVHGPSGREYVGSSADVRHRWRVHRYLLRRGEHPARALQAAWDTDGEEALSCALLTPCAHPVARLALEREAIRARRPAFNGVTNHVQRGARMNTSARVALNARVDPALRDAARAAATQQGMSLNDFICCALQAAISPPSSRQEPKEPRETGVPESDVLRLVELLTADMHLVREVLHAAYPRQEEDARTTTRTWLSRLGIGQRRHPAC